MEVIKLNARSRDIAESTLNLYLDQCKNSTLMRSQRALVVDGKTLIYILDKRANIQHLFLNLTKMCSSVLACRATPLQVLNGLILSFKNSENNKFHQASEASLTILRSVQLGTLGN